MISLSASPGYLSDRRRLDEQGIGNVGVGTGDKMTSVPPAIKSFSIELIGLLLGDAIGPKKLSNKLPVVLSYIGGSGTVHWEAYENQRPCAVAHPARPQGRPCGTRSHSSSSTIPSIHHSSRAPGASLRAAPRLV
jgi:hypothetical protein